MTSANPKPLHPRLLALGQALAQTGAVDSKSMIRSSGLSINDKVFAMVVKEQLVLKLPKDAVDRLTAAGKGTPFTSGGRVMREWVVVSDDVEDEHAGLAGMARSYVSSL
jgi:TfoX/Sxy family transcriptional regulator of competence genes